MPDGIQSIRRGMGWAVCDEPHRVRLLLVLLHCQPGAVFHLRDGLLQGCRAIGVTHDHVQQLVHELGIRQTIIIRGDMLSEPEDAFPGDDDSVLLQILQPSLFALDDVSQFGGVKRVGSFELCQCLFNLLFRLCYHLIYTRIDQLIVSLGEKNHAFHYRKDSFQPRSEGSLSLPFVWSSVR